MLPISQRLSDSPDFIARVETVGALALQARPAHLILIRVDNWFGERWVGFGGKVLGLAGISFKDNLVLPPFVPSRIVEQVCYRFESGEGRYVREECAGPVHVQQASEANLRRLVGALFPTSALVWFSDQSAQNGRGSVMAYIPTDAGHVAWFAEFSARQAWAPTRLVGLTRKELLLASELQPV